MLNLIQHPMRIASEIAEQVRNDLVVRNDVLIDAEIV